MFWFVVSIFQIIVQLLNSAFGAFVAYFALKNFAVPFGFPHMSFLFVWALIMFINFIKVDSEDLYKIKKKIEEDKEKKELSKLQDWAVLRTISFIHNLFAFIFFYVLSLFVNT